MAYSFRACRFLTGLFARDPPRKKMGGGRTLFSSDSALQVPTFHSLVTAGFSVRFFDEMIGFTQHSESGTLSREFGVHPPSSNLTSLPVGPVWLPVDGDGHHSTPDLLVRC
ncbi:MAG: hypothetical protein OXF06_12860 [Bacteroidetes bacterium]|nr:hypothetical protein [Bacteroidota bacterium]